MHSDPIADLLTRIRNGAQARLATVDIPHSKIKLEILRILQAEGYIKSFEVTTESKFPTIRIELRYDTKRKPVFTKISRVSRPGLRIYKATDEIRPIRSGLATRIISM